jgi:hypothetical protein
MVLMTVINAACGLERCVIIGLSGHVGVEIDGAAAGEETGQMRNRILKMIEHAAVKDDVEIGKLDGLIFDIDREY